MSIRLRILGQPWYKGGQEFTSHKVASDFKMEDNQVRGAIHDMYKRREIDKIGRIKIAGAWYDIYQRRLENTELRRPWVNWRPEDWGINARQWAR